MKINALLKTDKNYGDHGEKIMIAINVNPDDTIQNLIEKHLLESHGNPKMSKTNDHIEIRVTK
ncbi:hypothetical protein KAR91_13040 [Candidatus Pacearchaeota archaeon]|nr:hypothetical protein [Candidatus Pacearchaeota archaeon]